MVMSRFIATPPGTYDYKTKKPKIPESKTTLMNNTVAKVKKYIIRRSIVKRDELKIEKDGVVLYDLLKICDV